MDERDDDPRVERAVRYVEGDMDEAERAAFEFDMSADPSICEDVEAARKTITGLQWLGEQRLREQLRSADAELDGSMATPLRRTWWWAVAASIVMIGGAWWFMKEETPQQLADQYAIEEQGLPVLMGTSPRTMDAIMNAYKQGDMATAGSLLQMALVKDPSNDTLHYFTAIVLERTEGCKKAHAEFMQVPQSSVFSSRSLFHSAICALHDGDIERCRVLAQRVAAVKDDQLSAKARELLARLERVK